jgi:hypothetical protein
MFIRVLFFAVVVLSFNMKAQNWEFGSGLAPEFNFQTTSIGLEGKGYVGYGNFALTPKYTYYPSAIINDTIYDNIVQERFFSLGLQYMINPNNRYHFYGLVEVAFNVWMNHGESTMFNVGPNNVFPQLGVGAMRTYGCVRPYADIKYNYFWKEASARIGILWFPFNCTEPSSNYCPAFN